MYIYERAQWKHALSFFYFRHSFVVVCFHMYACTLLHFPSFTVFPLSLSRCSYSYFGVLIFSVSSIFFPRCRLSSSSLSSVLLLLLFRCFLFRCKVFPVLCVVIVYGEIFIDEFLVIVIIINVKCVLVEMVLVTSRREVCVNVGGKKKSLYMYNGKTSSSLRRQNVTFFLYAIPFYQINVPLATKLVSQSNRNRRGRDSGGGGKKPQRKMAVSVKDRHDAERIHGGTNE